MFRLIHPADRQELPLRMLFHPAEDGIFLRACEADGFRGLVAALLDDPGYESADVRLRLLHRIRLANDVALLSAIQDRQLHISDTDEPNTLNLYSDVSFIRSLERLGILSLGSPDTPAVPQSPQM
jgi:hypothetical protein